MANPAAYEGLRGQSGARWITARRGARRTDIVVAAPKAAWEQGAGNWANSTANRQRRKKPPWWRRTGTIGLGHGLRHHRHRGPDFRAGEIQESWPAAATGRSSTAPSPRRCAGARATRESRQIAEIEAYGRRPWASLLQTHPADQRLHAEKPRGFTDEALAKVEAALPPTPAFDIKFRLQQMDLWRGSFWRDTLKLEARRPLPQQVSHLPLRGRLFPGAKIEGRQASHICRRHGRWKAPRNLKAEHYSVFDCANPCGKIGKRLSVGGKATSA